MELAKPPAPGPRVAGTYSRPGAGGPGAAGRPGRATRRRNRWRIRCRDVANRRCHLTVLVDRNRVVLVGPPGETAVLSSGQLGQLRTALREAAEQAGR
ncbi:hypothetical protein GCM10012275_30640 [Longimycelium tulufanense]|uniref:Uncharacterized protein n=1 Tax=Longimycelium tulufanense TaxID=907463 RepID=A0A8J3C8S0_9PSEU|nr:hypothetical protein [Longimycelium tulufanense]GGM57400.1 hypothetical protein GCM10012275_30640 [Longimycelium tulufanense]